MKTHRNPVRVAKVAAVALCATVGLLLATPSTPAQAHVSVSVGIGVPGVPVYAPAPVYYPRPAYYPRPVYYGPAYYPRPIYYPAARYLPPPCPRPVAVWVFIPGFWDAGHWVDGYWTTQVQYQ